ncbi:MAG: hypothetical protein ACK6CU_00685, partial [Deltaproteobacteria bacterium]
PLASPRDRRTALVDAPHHPVRAFLEVHHDRGEAPVTIRGTVRMDYDLFTTVTTLGTPHDVTTQEVRIESYFPADEFTRTWMQGAKV